MKIKLLIVFIVFSIFVFVDNGNNINEVLKLIELKQFKIALIYFLLYILGIIAILILLSLNLFWRSITYLFLFIGIIFEMGYTNLNKVGFGYEDALLVLQEYDSPLAIESFLTFVPQFYLPIIYAIIIIIFLEFIFKKYKLRIRKKMYQVLAILFVALVSLLIYNILLLTNSNKSSYPVFFKIPLLLIYADSHKLYIGDREKVTIPKKKALFKHIIYIVDESIRGDKLQINGFKENTTPYLFTIKNKLHNFGVASSGAICSSYANSILLTGIQTKNLPDKEGLYSRTKPTIFQYAKNNGYKTYLIDSQNSHNKPNNFLTLDDLPRNQYFIGQDSPDIPYYERDLLAIKKLKEIVSTNNQTFTYMVKYGSHFNYENTYPQNKKPYTPTLNISQPSEWIKENKEKFLNSYYNSLNWNVDHFFKELHRELNASNVLIVYTSDHAQNLMDYLDIKQTHCLKGQAAKEISQVPLFLFPLGKENISLLNKLDRSTKKINYNKASHFNIFPTLLYLMGYQKDIIKNKYGSNLFDNLSKNNRIYTSGDLFGRSKIFINSYDKINKKEIHNIEK